MLIKVVPGNHVSKGGSRNLFPDCRRCSSWQAFDSTMHQLPYTGHKPTVASMCHNNWGVNLISIGGNANRDEISCKTYSDLSKSFSTSSTGFLSTKKPAIYAPGPFITIYHLSTNSVESVRLPYRVDCYCHRGMGHGL